jgi:NitT/TauT family transport system substrate-binding protein
VLAALLGALAVAAALAGCGGGGGGGGGGNGARTVTVAIPPVISGVDVYVAQEQGFFARHQLDVSVKVLNGGAAIVPAMQSGAVDVGETNVVSVIQSATRGITEPCFTGANTDPPSGTYLSLVTGRDAGVGDPAALRGRTVAVNATNGVNQLLVQAYLDQHGVDPRSVRFVSLQYPDMPQALSSGRVAAAVTSEPFTTIALGQGSRVLVGTPLTAVPGTPTYSCWNASSAWLGAHRAEAADFAAAMSDTDAWIAAHPTEFRAVAARHLTIPADVLGRMTLPVFTDELSDADIDAWQLAAQRYGLIDHPPARADVFAPLRGGSR